MSDLQNKLDRHGPPDFDRAALWNKIERPRRRRRVFFIWWVSGAAALALGAYLWNVHWLSDKRVSTSFPIPQEKLDQTPTVIEKPQVTELKGEVDIMGSKTSAIQRVDKAETTITTPSINEMPKNEWGNLSVPDGPSGQNRLVQPMETSSYKRTFVNTSARALIPLSPLAGLPALVSALQESPAEKGTTASSMKPLSSLPPIPFSPLDNARWSLDVPGPKQRTLRRNEFAITLGAAGQWRLLDGKQCTRIKEKPTLSGYFLGARYKRKLPKGPYLFAGLTYTYNQSKITDSTVESRQFYEELAGKTILKTTTFYELYNQYHRLDFAIGAGRSWPLQGFEVALEAGLGAAHWLKIDGDYLDDSAGIQPLPGAEAVRATLFGRLNGGLSRALPNGFRLGLNISGQTPIRVSPKGEACRHRLLPIYLGMSMGKQF